MKKLLVLVGIFSLGLVCVASAHSTVSPSSTATSKYENFSLSVPTEKEVPTTGVRLLVPDSIERITPFVKPGWTINISKNEAGKITQIEWNGGSIPAGQKDAFLFTARTPATDTDLIWKVYQTYQGGEVVAWDQDPSGTEHGEGEVSNPYSKTEVKADVPVSAEDDSSKNNYQAVISWAALAVALVAFWRTRK